MHTCPLTGSKLAWGPKLQQNINLLGLKKVIFFKGLKSQLWKT